MGVAASSDCSLSDSPSRNREDCLAYEACEVKSADRPVDGPCLVVVVPCGCHSWKKGKLRRRKQRELEEQISDLEGPDPGGYAPQYRARREEREALREQKILELNNLKGLQPIMTYEKSPEGHDKIEEPSVIPGEKTLDELECEFNEKQAWEWHRLQFLPIGTRYRDFHRKYWDHERKTRQEFQRLRIVEEVRKIRASELAKREHEFEMEHARKWDDMVHRQDGVARGHWDRVWKTRTHFQQMRMVEEAEKLRASEHQDRAAVKLAPERSKWLWQEAEEIAPQRSPPGKLMSLRSLMPYGYNKGHYGWIRESLRLRYRMSSATYMDHTDANKTPEEVVKGLWGLI